MKLFNRFNGFRRPFKPLKRLRKGGSHPYHRAKSHGVNENAPRDECYANAVNGTSRPSHVDFLDKADRADSLREADANDLVCGTS